jgi:hypothetical protein
LGYGRPGSPDRADDRHRESPDAAGGLIRAEKMIAAGSRSTGAPAHMELNPGGVGCVASQCEPSEGAPHAVHRKHLAESVC